MSVPGGSVKITAICSGVYQSVLVSGNSLTTEPRSAAWAAVIDDGDARPAEHLPEGIMLEQNERLALDRDLGVQRQPQANVVAQLAPHLRIVERLLLEASALAFVAGIVEIDQQHLVLLVRRRYRFAVAAQPMHRGAAPLPPLGLAAQSGVKLKNGAMTQDARIRLRAYTISVFLVGLGESC